MSDIMSNYENNPKLKLAFNFVQFTNRNVFLTGKAGTGKTTFLKSIRDISPKRMVVVAPTGVAAINAGGVTIHSFFQLPFGPVIPQNGLSRSGNGNTTPGHSDRIFKFSKNKINLIKSLDLLVIDEVSMVRPDLLDAIDATLRRYKNRFLPFGGVQVLMIGDLQQLAPVIKDEEWDILKNYYDTCYFFSSHALKQATYIGIELNQIYRQSDQHFIDILNKVRDNKLSGNDLNLLNKRFIPNFSPPNEEGYITLTTHNYQARQINKTHLLKLSAKSHCFNCIIEGEFPEHAYPADEILEVKQGAQVMFIKNDSSPFKRYYNGKLGKIKNIRDHSIEIICPGETDTIVVEQDNWDNTKYKLNENTLEIEEEVIGRFYQFPLKLAWAITIHKSQGLTFEKAVIDVNHSFTHGQVYVALSRCKSIEGLVLSSPIRTQSVINDETITRFTEDIYLNQPDENELEHQKKQYIINLLIELTDFNILAKKAGFILKIWDENNSVLLGNLQENLILFMTRIREELILVAEKFQAQIKRITQDSNSPEEDEFLQERLLKAAHFFLPRLKTITEAHLYNANYSTDNRSLQKRMSELIDKLEKEIEIKKSCWKAVSNNFSIKEYLTARALASIEIKKTNSREKSTPVSLDHPDFYARLFKWRNNKSIETGLDASKVLMQKVMVQISKSLPATANELKKIKGMGGKKMENFGKDILDLSLTYRKEKSLELPENPQFEIELAGMDTKEISLTLYKKGHQIVEIAKIRNLSITTIETHMTHYIEKGELDIFEFMNQEKYNQIAGYISKLDNPATITEIRNALGESISFGEIRMVIANLDHQTS